ncbi:MAG: hydrogenase maturation protein HypF [Candidatus Accumulibacter regalis]|jgi:[NiFe] hydrogenase maturation protein HypF
MAESVVCQNIRVSGVVQGVGFRPFVWRLARELGLGGWVRNDSRGVEIEVCGAAEQVKSLIDRLEQEAPPLARVSGVVARAAAPAAHDGREFVIIDSRSGRVGTMIGHDTAVCRDCLAETFEPSNRRWRYAFSNCTNCGPRYTISRGLPYDRVRTSLKPFVMCPKCQHEYRKPEDRRFHAEANCCPKCGPQLRLVDAEGQPLPGDPLAATLALLRAGKIVAIKGLGGFHLACDARNAVAVALLRERKQRDEKPFVVMLANAASAAMFVQMGIGEPGLLTLPTRPAILIKKRGNCDAALPGVAPGLSWLGVMLPYTPLQFLLFHEAANRPPGLGWLERAQDLALVMTSANPGGEPLVVGNNEALLRLYGIADAFLTHDRDIVTRCDDSVARITSGGLQFIRRARGYTPRAIKLPISGPSVLAVGGWFKNTICVTRGDEAFVSQHVGDLDNAAVCDFLEENVAQMVKLLGVEPAIVAHDLHPDFHSTRFAAEFAEQRRLPLLGVQHHHAHAAAVLAEHGMQGKALALSLDGVGVGSDGAAWGGGTAARRWRQLQAPRLAGAAGASRRRPRGQRTLADGGSGAASTRAQQGDRRALRGAAGGTGRRADARRQCQLSADVEHGADLRRRRRSARDQGSDGLRRPGGDAARGHGAALRRRPAPGPGLEDFPGPARSAAAAGGAGR